MKTILTAALIFFVASTTVTFAQESIPTVGGSNAAVVADPTPTTEGSNANDATGIIPNPQGSNANDASSFIIPTMGGSNDSGVPAVTTTVDAQVDAPVVGGSNDNGTPSGQDSVLPVIGIGKSAGSNSTGGSGGVARTTADLTIPSIADGASCTYLNDYLGLARNNNPVEVTKLQEFLNKYEGFNLAVTGIYDQATFNAVKAFQGKYLSETMLPWGWKVGSGIVSFTTKKKINEIYCKSNFNLSPDQLARIQAYKTRLLATPTRTTPVVVTPTPIPAELEATTTPENPGIDVGFNVPALNSAPTNDLKPLPSPITQTASANDASSGILDSILDLFNKIF